MHSTLTPGLVETTRTFPFLAIFSRYHDGVTVPATDEQFVIMVLGYGDRGDYRGVVVAANANAAWPIGDESTRWGAECFDRFTGSIELSN